MTNGSNVPFHELVVGTIRAPHAVCGPLVDRGAPLRASPASSHHRPGWWRRWRRRARRVHIAHRIATGAR